MLFPFELTADRLRISEPMLLTVQVIRKRIASVQTDGGPYPCREGFHRRVVSDPAVIVERLVDHICKAEIRGMGAL